MGKKYIIELEDENYHQYSDSESSDYLWRVKGFNSLVFDEVGLRKLTPYIAPDIEHVKDETYMAGYKAGREAERMRHPNLEQIKKEAYDDGYKKRMSELKEEGMRVVQNTRKII